MKNYTKEEMAAIYNSRREKLFKYLSDNKIAAVVFEDTEGKRTPAVRYFTGHPSDAIFIARADGKCVLIPWDYNLAQERAVNIEILPYTDFGREAITAVAKYTEDLNSGFIELDPVTPYPVFLKYVKELEKLDVLCRENSTHDYVAELRAVKDQYEIDCTKEACRVGDIIINLIEQGVKDESIKTETDVALLIEKELRKYGCERVGFDTLAAGPSRSFAIHAFPGFTAAPWPAQGLSILDFGVVYEGYTSDTTLTVAKGPLTEEQEELLTLVEEAAKKALKLYQPGKSIKEACLAADKVFAKAKRVMPHALGHGIGLEIHEAPRVSSKVDEEALFKPGHIVTLEPGLYDPALGGVRLENDVLITEKGNEVITNSKIIRV